MRVPVYLELGSKKVFAAAVEWPGWCRSGRAEDDALDNLAGYAERYAPVVGRAGLAWRPGPSIDFDIVERIKGSATTDFGAPGSVPELDQRELAPAGARRLAALVQASWDELEAVAAGAPATLRKGPRGGGRDRDAVVAHVEAAEAAYGRKLGNGPGAAERREHGHRLVRERIIESIRSGGAGESKGWPAAYAARRIAWHVLDHAWEIQDRSE